MSRSYATIRHGRSFPIDRPGYAGDVFRRRTTAEAESSETTAAQTVVESERPAQPTPKGRPTPKRREAEQARRERVRPPRDRREAARVQRARMKAERAKVQQALASGDERYLPARDRGPQRRFLRNYVDSRRTVAEYLLPFFLVIFVMMMIQIQLVLDLALVFWMVAVVFTAVDLFFLARRVKRELRERFPGESYKGATGYALMRATQLRKLRLPKPQLKPGDPIPDR